MPFRSHTLQELVLVGKENRDPQLIQDVIKIFLRQAPALLEAAWAATIGGDIQTARFDIHKLKANAGVVGSEIITDLCQQLDESLADSIHSLQLLRCIRSEIEKECLQLSDELNIYLLSIQPALS